MEKVLALFIVSVVSDLCLSQYVYNGLLPYDPRYAMRRPVRRSAMEALERLRLPVARYFPQVDTQVAPAPYQGGPSALLSRGYQYSPSDLYALPPQWTDDFAQRQLAGDAAADEEGADYGNYEYENSAPYSPVYRARDFAYADDVYPQEPVSGDSENAAVDYSDLMPGYLMEQPTVERRSNRGEAAQKVSDSNSTVGGNTTPPPSSAASKTPAPVQMTVVPPSPEKKNIQSMILPDPVQSQDDDPWSQTGQKEEPLFRPLQNSQRTTWNTPLSRAKNTHQKSSIPALKQMMEHGQRMRALDPLLEELNSLKKKPGV